MTDWTTQEIPDQSGRTVVITGANTGIGFEAAKVLAARGATVVLVCRDTAKAERARQTVTGHTEVVELDLASLAAVHSAAEHIRRLCPRVDLLINNAGVMMTPFGHTADGFELQFGTNHLGHFALTGLLLDLLTSTPGSRVVTVSSSATRQGTIDLSDPNFQHRKYRPIAAYAQSKLANLLFSLELNERLSASGAETIAVALEPGLTPTDLPRHLRGPIRWTTAAITKLLGQPDAAAGARILLRAALDPDARGGDYYAPDGRPPLRASGSPIRIEPLPTDPGARQALWTESERLTATAPRFSPRAV